LAIMLLTVAVLQAANLIGHSASVSVLSQA